jgi:hypothetical protein
MTVILIVEKSGNIKETNVKKVQVTELYKKAGFKTDEGFTEPIISWPRPGLDPFTLDYQIQVFGKIKGRAGQENKYDFPPPIDSTLFFGNVVLIAVRPDGGGVVDLTMTAWEMVYEQLFGGFEDLVDSQGRSLDDSEEEDTEDLENVEGYEYTKEGYVKDDFIVDDNEIEEEDEEKEDKVFRKNMLLDSDEDSEFELPKAYKNKKKLEKKMKDVKVVKQIIEAVEKYIENPEIPPQEEEVEIPESEEEIKPTKKQRKPRAVKEPKESKVKKEKVPKEPKEKTEPKKKTKRSGKKNMDEDNSETVYVPLDTIELEEENYV